MGLEYILQTFGVSASDLATEFNIDRSNVSLWISGKREIPKKYLPRLSEKFNLPEEYFLKQLTEIDKIVIHKQKLVNEVSGDEFIREFIDGDGNKHVFNEPILPQFIRKKLLDFDFQIKREKILEQMKKIMYYDDVDEQAANLANNFIGLCCFLTDLFQSGVRPELIFETFDAISVASKLEKSTINPLAYTLVRVYEQFTFNEERGMYVHTPKSSAY